MAYQFWRPIVRTLGLLAAGVLICFWLLGGLLFWTPQLAAIFVIGETAQPSNLELAQSGLKNVKRMVGEGDAWLYTIQREYDHLFVGQANPLFNQTYTAIDPNGQARTATPPGSYSANFLQSSHSPLAPTTD